MRTRLSMVFQHFNLWSHLSVLENVMEAPLKVLGLSRQEALDRARAYLEKVGLAPRLEQQYPSHLSGGQQQRVATRAGVWLCIRTSCSSTNRRPRSTRNWSAKC